MGTGTLRMPLLVNEGRVSPGFSPGVLTIDGEYEQLAVGELDIVRMAFEVLIVELCHEVELGTLITGGNRRLPC